MSYSRFVLAVVLVVLHGSVSFAKVFDFGAHEAGSWKTIRAVNRLALSRAISSDLGREVTVEEMSYGRFDYIWTLGTQLNMYVHLADDQAKYVCNIFLRGERLFVTRCTTDDVGVIKDLYYDVNELLDSSVNQ